MTDSDCRISAIAVERSPSRSSCTRHSCELSCGIVLSYRHVQGSFAPASAMGVQTAGRAADVCAAVILARQGCTAQTDWGCAAKACSVQRPGNLQCQLCTCFRQAQAPIMVTTFGWAQPPSMATCSKAQLVASVFLVWGGMAVLDASSTWRMLHGLMTASCGL